MSAPQEIYKNANPPRGTPFCKQTAEGIATQDNIHTLNEALEFGEHSFADQQRIVRVVTARALINTPKGDPLYAAIKAINDSPERLRAEATRVSSHPEEWPFFAQALRNAKAEAAQAQAQAQAQ